MTDRMAALDAYFLFAEADGVNHMHVGGFAVASGSTPSKADVERMLRGKLSLIPRYRQVVRTVPLSLGRPVWEDATDFRLQRHVHHVKLDAPGRNALSECVGQFISRPLDRAHPLWELLIIDGLGEGEFAVAWKIHHCMVDGVSGTELLTVLFDDSPSPTTAVLDHWRPRPADAKYNLIAGAAYELVGRAAHRARQITPVQLRAAVPAARAAVSLGSRIAIPDLRLPLNGPVGPDRSFGFVAVPLSEVKNARHALDGTLNDLVLSAVLHGFADYLRYRGVSLRGRVIRIMVPVALRDRDEHGRPLGDGTMETKASGLVAALPLDVTDPAERVSIVHGVLNKLKSGSEAAAINAINEISGLLPATVTAVATRLMSKLPQRAINTVVTNVPGPPMPLYVLGRPIDRIFNYAPLFPVGARSSVTVYSYQDHLQFGVTADRNSMPDIHILVDGIKVGVEQLVKAAAQTSS